MHIACQSGHFDSVEALLASPSININALNNNGETPLDLAQKNNHTKIIILLIEKEGVSGYLRKKSRNIK